MQHAACSKRGSPGPASSSTKAPQRPAPIRRGNASEWNTRSRIASGTVGLTSDEYTDGHVDWEDFRATALPAQAAPPAPPAQSFAVARRHPAPVRYPGMPAERYWEFEDADVNFAGAEAGVTDLLRLTVTEFALTFGNDWFIVPVRLPVGGLYDVSAFEVTDTLRNYRAPRSDPGRGAGALDDVRGDRRCESAGHAQTCGAPPRQSRRRAGRRRAGTHAARARRNGESRVGDRKESARRLRRTARPRAGGERTRVPSADPVRQRAAKPTARVPAGDTRAGELDAASARARSALQSRHGHS